MKIGIDISQIVYEGTGVAHYTRKLVENLLKIDKRSEYILFFSSLRKKFPMPKIKSENRNLKIKIFKIPPILLDILWNRLHICPIEWFIGQVDVFLCSDWTQPPSKKAKLITTVHDLTPCKFPESLHPKIVAVQKRRLKWVKKEADFIIAVSHATKKDIMEILKIPAEKIKVIYEGGK